MTGLLIIVAIVLIFLVIIQIGRAGELVTNIKGEAKMEDSSKVQAALMLAFLVIGMILMVWSVFHFKDRFLPEASSIHGKEIDELFNITLFFTGIVFVATQVLLFWFVWRYRERKGRQAYYIADDNKLELIWTIIPAIVLTFLVVKGMSSWYSIMEPAPEDRIEIEATGKQFDWIIRYPGQDGQFGDRYGLDSITGSNQLAVRFSDPAAQDDVVANEIHLPVDVPVLVKIYALDVLHSFYLPHFRVKMDAVPGVPTYFWFTPTKTTAQMREDLDNPDFDYELACAELCGTGHNSMRKVVVVETQEEYDEWLASQKSYYELIGGGGAADEGEDTEDDGEGPVSEMETDTLSSTVDTTGNSQETLSNNE